jgi:hypothetical protein
MFMNSHNRINLNVGKGINRVVHLSNRQVPECIQRAIVQGLPQRTFNGQTFNPRPFVNRCKLHVDSPPFADANNNNAPTDDIKLSLM